MRALRPAIGLVPILVLAASAFAVPIPDVLYLHVDEPSWTGAAGEVFDSSGSGSHGTAKGGATTAANGYFGRAGTFTGSNYVELTTGSVTPSGKTMTLEAWVKPDAFSTWSHDGIVVVDSTRYYMKLYQDGKIGAYFLNGVNQWFDTGAVRVPGDQWSHIVAVCDGDAGEESLWLNGTKVATQTGTMGNLSHSGAEFRVGYEHYHKGFKGAIDEVGIYNRDLTPHDILVRYEMGPVPDLLHYPMEESGWTGAPNEVIDSSGKAHHGTAVGDADTVPNGYFGGAGEFDGSGDAVDAGTSLGLTSTDAITLEAWIKPEDVGRGGGWKRDQTIIGRSTGYYFAISDAGLLRSIYYGTNQGWLDGPDMTPYEGEWTHVAARFDGSEEALFINGTKVASQSVTGSLATPVKTTYVGHVDYSRYFTGQIDDAGIYSRALGDAEIWKLAHTAPTPDVLYVHMDERSWNGTAGEVVDASGAGHHGTRVGGANTVGVGGVLYRAGEFSGSGDAVTFGNDTSLVPSGKAMSISAWIKPDWETWSHGGIIAGRRNSYYLEVNADGELRSHFGAWLVGPDLEAYGDEWVHVAVTRDGVEEILWVSGEEVASRLASNNIPGSTLDRELFIGYVDGNRWFNGLIDEVGIYSRALSEREIRLLARVPEPTSLALLGAGLTALWRRRKRQPSPRT